jgi:hypothetical protein
MTLKINDRVTFKSNGTEEHGRITHIDSGTATIKVWDSMVGEHYLTFEKLGRCSKD